jgi:hypothetical protein
MQFFSRKTFLHTQLCSREGTSKGKGSMSWNCVPQSPDLSPIKNIWAIIKNKIFDMVNETTSIHALTKTIEEIFFHDETILSAIRYYYDFLQESRWSWRVGVAILDIERFVRGISAYFYFASCMYQLL